MLDLPVELSLPAIWQANALRTDSRQATLTGLVRAAGGTRVPLAGSDSIKVMAKGYYPIPLAFQAVDAVFQMLADGSDNKPPRSKALVR